MSDESREVFLQFINKIAEENEKLTKLLLQVQELHEESMGMCSHDSFRPYPCPTILALREVWDA